MFPQRYTTISPVRILWPCYLLNIHTFCFSALEIIHRTFFHMHGSVKIIHRSFLPIYMRKKKYPVYTEHLVKTDTAAGRGRTGTGITTHGILSPGRLPIPPLRHIQFALKATRMGLEPMTSAVTGRRSNQLSHRAL